MKKIYSLAIGSLYVFMISCGGSSTTQTAQQAETTTSSTEQAGTESPHGHQAQGTQDNQVNTSHASAQNQVSSQAVAPGKEPASTIPDFKFYILKNGIKFDKNDIKAGQTHVFVLFDPSCSHCQHEARDIGKNFGSFKNTEFYFISMNDPALMSTFFTKYAPELNNKDNVHLLYDKDMHFVYKFHIPSQYPATYVYRPDGTLKGFWNGAKSAEDIIKSITM